MQPLWITWLHRWFPLSVLWRYLVVGGSSAALEFAAFNILVYLAKLPVLPANLAASLFVVVFGFLSHRHFTFKSRGQYSRQLKLYLFMIGITVILNNLLVYLFSSALDWPPPLAKVLQLGICFAWNFTFSRLIVFSHRHGPQV